MFLWVLWFMGQHSWETDLGAPQPKLFCSMIGVLLTSQNNVVKHSTFVTGQ